jgi:flavin-dependent dehydrogenase
MVGFVVGLGYSNPHLSPFEEFQRYKTHPEIAASHLVTLATGVAGGADSPWPQFEHSRREPTRTISVQVKPISNSDP